VALDYGKEHEMDVLKEHLARHQRHMLGCGVAASVLVIGLILSIPSVAIVGAVACGAMCLSMVRMMILSGRSH
jgi:hypothetical protein